MQTFFFGVYLNFMSSCKNSGFYYMFNSNTDYQILRHIPDEKQDRYINYNNSLWRVSGEELVKRNFLCFVLRRIAAIALRLFSVIEVFHDFGLNQVIRGLWERDITICYIFNTPTDWKIYPVEDGYLQISMKEQFVDKLDSNKRLSESEINDLDREVYDKDLNKKTVVKVFLLVSEEMGKKILVDTGCGTQVKEMILSQGKVSDNLKNLNIKDGDITDVLISHNHFDHAGGINCFSHAHFYAAKEERVNFVEKNNKTIEFQDGVCEIFPGIKAVHSPGHTKGHTSFIVNDKMLILGDVVHNEKIQFQHPDIPVKFDQDCEKALISRKKLFDRSVCDNLYLFGTHMQSSYMLFNGSKKEKYEGYAIHEDLSFLVNLDNRSESIEKFIVYSICNEIGTNEVIEKIRRTDPKKREKNVHIGCGGWYNLDVIFHRRSDYGIIFDVNHDCLNFMRKTLEVILKCEKRYDFKEEMLKYIKENKRCFLSPQVEANLKDSLDKSIKVTKNAKSSRYTVDIENVFDVEDKRENSWIHNDEGYEYIRNLVLEGRLFIMNQNVENVEAFKEMKKELVKKELKVDTLYTSSICSFVDKEKFKESIKELVDFDSLLLSCPKNLENSEFPLICQKVLTGKEIKENDSQLIQV